MRTHRQKTAILAAATGLALTTAVESRAHSVFIYAWAEGGSICAESYFGGDEKARGVKVTMRDAAGEILAETATDDAGRACFAAPREAMPLRFVVDAGQGHRAEYTMPEAEVAAAVAAAPAREEQAEKAVAAELAGNTAASPAAAPVPTIDAERLRSLIREELQAQLTPLRQTLAQATAPKRPGLKEIVGGLGWIAGLAALAHFGLARRKDRSVPAEKPQTDPR